MMRVCRTSPGCHERATLADEPRGPQATTPRARGCTPPPHSPNPQQHPAYMRARARPISRARALPTNRHEGGSLT